MSGEPIVEPIVANVLRRSLRGSGAALARGAGLLALCLAGVGFLLFAAMSELSRSIGPALAAGVIGLALLAVAVMFAAFYPRSGRHTTSAYRLAAPDALPAPSPAEPAARPSGLAADAVPAASAMEARPMETAMFMLGFIMARIAMHRLTAPARTRDPV